MALSWSTRRKLLYYGAGFIVLTTLLFVGYQTFFTRTPTCTDGIKNGNEAGVDCGGSCPLLCEAQAEMPRLLWVRAFPAILPSYTAVAYVQNLNIGAGARQVGYAFRLFDSNNSLIVERRGTVDIPPVQVVPIMETNIDVGNRVVARTFFEFTDEPVWTKVPADTLPPLRITDQSLEADGTRLSATIVNDSQREARQISAIAVLFDSQGIARAASRSLIGTVRSKSAEPLVFTWPDTLAEVARAEITLLPSF